MTEDSRVYVAVGGKKFSGWTSVKITMKLESLARTFEIGYTQSAGAVDPLKIGDAVEVLIGDDLVLTGWITKTSTAITSKTVTRTISGAGKTIDLGDCCLPKDAQKQYRDLRPKALMECRAH